jgi:hypothetical protein
MLATYPPFTILSEQLEKIEEEESNFSPDENEPA